MGLWRDSGTVEVIWKVVGGARVDLLQDTPWDRRYPDLGGQNVACPH